MLSRPCLFLCPQRMLRAPGQHLCASAFTFSVIRMHSYDFLPQNPLLAKARCNQFRPETGAQDRQLLLIILSRYFHFLFGRSKDMNSAHFRVLRARFSTSSAVLAENFPCS